MRSPFLTLWLSLHKLRDVDAADPDCVANADVRELAMFAEPVDGRRAYAEPLGHIPHGKQRFMGVLGGKFL
jgi:hypothetical protein